MANYLGVSDAYSLINSISAQALGSDALQVVDTSTFVTVGEKILQTGVESTLNAIGYVIGKTIFSIRPYRSKLSSLEREPERWGFITRKITYLFSGAEATQDYNTDLNTSTLADGSSVDMFKIRAPKVVQTNFPGAQSLESHITRFRDQIKIAFSSPEEFIAFWEGVMVEFYNDIETIKESRSRAVLLNFMAALYDKNLNVVDLVETYNSENSTSYTRAQLLTTYKESFYKWVAGEVQLWSDLLTDRNVLYHENVVGYDKIPRHSPKDRQRMIMLNPFFVREKAEIYTSLFNPDYLNIGDFEAVNFWQSPTDKSRIKVTPNTMSITTGNSETGNAVDIPYVLGMLYDEESLGVMPKFDYVSVTPFNSAGGYYNTYIHWLFKSYNDFTENAVLFILGDGGEDEPVTPGE